RNPRGMVLLLVLCGALGLLQSPAWGMGYTTFALPGATGSGSGTVTTFSCVTANGVSCSVANATTTPAATFTLGAITPTTVNGLTITSSTGALTVPNGVTLTGPALSGTALASNQANTGTSAITLDLSAATGSNAFKVPVKASITTAVN